MGKKKGAPVVISRKDKRIRHKITHAFLFGATGGVSGIVTAAEAANHAAYNARTRQLQDQAEAAEAAEPITHRIPEDVCWRPGFDGGRTADSIIWRDGTGLSGPDMLAYVQTPEGQRATTDKAARMGTDGNLLHPPPR